MMTTEEWNDKPCGEQTDPIAQARAEGRAEGIREACQTVLAEALHLYNETPEIHAALMRTHDALLTLIDAPAPTQPAQVRVKPLVWRSEGDGWRHAGQPEGKGFANFCLWVWKDLEGSEWRFSNRTERYPTLEDAKAAAQAEYEARIIAALEHNGGPRDE